MWPINDYFTILVLALLIALLIYYYGTSTYDYWKKKGIPYVKPKYPFFGTSFELIFSLKSIPDKQLEFYKYFNGERIGGLFSLTTPMLFLRDPDLIETIMIKEFDSFYNRGTGVDLELDPLSANLVNLEDQNWKNLRQKLTPTFTSGKLKGMHQQLVDCSDLLLNYIKQYADRDEPIEARELMAEFSIGVISSCVFGLNTNVLNDERDSEFRKMGREVFKPTFISRIRFVIRRSYPGLLRLLNWKNRPEYVRFFTNMIQSTISYREKNNIVRNDFIQLLMELKKQDALSSKNGTEENEYHLIMDDKIITANAFGLFAAGFETTSSTLSYCMYEMSQQPELQEQAYNHVVAVLAKHGGEITYDAILDMPLIKQIFAETLRIHPPVCELRRVVTKPFTIPGTTLTLPKGFYVIIPIYSLHRDPEHFPEPDKFKPERFDKNLNNIKKGTYIPYGEGPRICIGKRFAEMELQVAFVKLLLKYKFTLNPKTKTPLPHNRSTVLLAPIGGIWIDLHKRI